MKNVTIIDYGMNNIKSVERAISEIGYNSVLSSNPNVILKSDRLILPGVGAFENGMKALYKVPNLISSIKEFVKTGKPLVAICLGMQMLLDSSSENGQHVGLSLIPGEVNIIPNHNNKKLIRKIPHVQWNSLKIKNSYEQWKDTYLKDTSEDDFFYFVHSYMAVPKNENDCLAYCDYEGLMLPAVIKKDNVIGFQFHPEKSARPGLKVLENFMLE